jgi:hypothetical protein
MRRAVNTLLLAPRAVRRRDRSVGRHSRPSLRSLVVAGCLAAAPKAALACPVCFGQNDSPLALGINYGILAMLGFVGSLLVAFASFFIYLARRARLAEAGQLPEPPARGHHVPHAQEGTT